jgi:hypothetical protein
MLIERESDGFVNLQAVYDNKAFRQNTNGHIFDDFVSPEIILNGTGTAYGDSASDILSALSDFFVDAPAGSGASDLLGGIAHDAPAPTPGVSGKYYFTTAGVCTWLPDSPLVNIGDEVIVVYTDPDYTYTLVSIGSQLDLKENTANKKTTLTDSDIDFPTTRAVKTVTDELKEKSLTVASEIASIENVINSMNPNQENRVTVTGVDTISLPKTAANTGMQVQVFGQSAENLVVNGDFRNGTTGWDTALTGVSLTVNNAIATSTRTTDGDIIGILRTSANPTPASIIYTLAKVRVLQSGASNISLVTGGSVRPIVTSPVANQWYFVSDKYTVGTAVRSGFRAVYPTGQALTGYSMEADYMMQIDLTATFGAGNEPTKEQCDLLFANYFEGTDNVLGTGRVRSVGKNLFDKSKFIDNRRYTSDTGLPITDTGFFSTNYIGCSPNTAYSHNRGAGSIWVTYDANLNILAFSSDGETIYTTPNDSRVKYIRVSTSKTNNTVDNYMVARSSIVPTTYSPFIQSALYLQTPEMRSNGLIKDEIRKGTNGYELIKRVGVGTLGANGIAGGDFEGGLIGILSVSDDTSTWTLNTTNPISGTQDGRLQVTTAGTNTARPRVRFLLTRSSGQLRKVSFNYKVNTGTCVLNTFSDGGIVQTLNRTLTGTGVFELYYVCGGVDILALNFNGTNLFDVQLDNVKDELINTPDGSTTSTSVTIIGSNIHYTLATPTITPIAHAGLLNSNSNGTAYFEPVIADAGVYGTSLAIQATDYPIASFESIRKYADGTYTELSLTSGLAIAPDGLSFTHTGLVSGDLVMFTYNYNRESISRSMTLTHYDSRFYPKWDDEYPSGQWVNAAANAAPDEVNVTIAGLATRKLAFGTGEAKSNMFEIRHGTALDFVNSGEMPIEFHIHMMPSTNNAGTAIFTFNWTYSPPQGAPIAGTPIDVTFTIAANRQYWHLLAGGNLALPVGGFAIGGKIDFTITRKATGNTYPDDILFDKCALHRPISNFGSINLYSN